MWQCGVLRKYEYLPDNDDEVYLACIGVGESGNGGLSKAIPLEKYYKLWNHFWNFLFVLNWKSDFDNEISDKIAADPGV